MTGPAVAATASAFGEAIVLADAPMRTTAKVSVDTVGRHWWGKPSQMVSSIGLLGSHW